MLFAAGGVAADGFLAGRRIAWLRPAYAAALVAAGVFFAPMSLPCLPPELYVRYSNAIGMQPPRIETHRMGPLPQLLADRFGWKEMAGKAAEIFRALPPEEREHARVFGQNYGQAGAIDMYGPALGLPPGPLGSPRVPRVGAAAEDPTVLIVLDDDRPRLEELFESVDVRPAGVGRIPTRCRTSTSTSGSVESRRVSLRELWPRLRELG